MNIEIVSNNDENFKIKVVQFGEQHIATDGERVAIGVTGELATEAVKDMQEQGIEAARNAAPLNNSSDGHPFDPFGGTSWAGKKQGFN